MPIVAAFSLSFAASVALLVALVLVAVALAIWVYRHTVPEISRSRRIVLVTLRSLALAVLLFLLFEPVLNLESTESIDPHVAVLVDDSRSLTIEDAGVPRSDAVRALVDDARFADLAGSGTSAPFLFGDKLYPLQQLRGDSLRFTSGLTDIGAALEQSAEALREKNLRAVVLVSDGIVTSGRSPLYAAEALGVPIYVIGVGDSTEKRDLLVGRVLANEIAYVESAMPVDATLRAAGLAGGTASVVLKDGATVVDRQTVALGEGASEYQVRFSYTPKAEGVRKLTVEAAPLAGELTVKNNRQTVFVTVRKSRMNVLVVAGAPSADVSMFEQVFRADRNVALDLHVQKPAGAWYGEAPSREKVMKADCIVLVGYPGPQSGTAVLQHVRAAVEQRGTPLMIVFSRELDQGALRSVLDPWLPYEAVQTRSDETQVFFEPGDAARQHPVSSTGIPQDAWSKLPPLFRTESSYKVRAGAQTLGAMKLNGIVFNEPLLLVRTLGRSKVTVFTGYGLWRWQLATDVAGGRLPELLLSNSVRWLTTRDDDKRVRVRPLRVLYDSGEPVEFAGQVYNESYEPVDDAVVTVTVHGEGEQRELVLGQLGAGRYTGAVEGLPEGDYTYTGVAMRDGKELGRDAGRFTVGEMNIEFLETRMNNQLLRQIAARSGGAVFTPDQLGSLRDAITQAPGFASAERTIKSDIPLWNLIWLLGAAILLFALEWMLRKQAGML